MNRVQSVSDVFEVMSIMAFIAMMSGMLACLIETAGKGDGQPNDAEPSQVLVEVAKRVDPVPVPMIKMMFAGKESYEISDRAFHPVLEIN